MFGLGFPELIVILLILLLLFGSKKLPELTKSLGESISALQKGLNNKEITENKKKKKKVNS